VKKKQTAGFTLVELTIVVAIIGILSAIGMNYYGDYVRETNRTDAKSALSRIASSLEKCRSLYAAYNSPNCNVVFPADSDEGYYSIAAAFPSAAAFTLTATPVAGRPQASDAECTSITLTNTGLKGSAPSGIDVCW